MSYIASSSNRGVQSGQQLLSARAHIWVVSPKSVVPSSDTTFSHGDYSDILDPSSLPLVYSISHLCFLPSCGIEFNCIFVVLSLPFLAIGPVLSE